MSPGRREVHAWDWNTRSCGRLAGSLLAPTDTTARLTDRLRMPSLRIQDLARYINASRMCRMRYEVFSDRLV